MKSTFLSDDARSVDLLDRAQNIICFVQATAEMWQGRKPTENELLGLIHILEAASFLIDESQDEARKPRVYVHEHCSSTAVF